AHVSAATTVDKVVHGPRCPVGLVMLLVMLEVMRVARHDDFHPVLSQELMDGRKRGFVAGQDLAKCFGSALLRRPFARNRLVAPRIIASMRSSVVVVSRLSVTTRACIPARAASGSRKLAAKPSSASYQS